MFTIFSDASRVSDPGMRAWRVESIRGIVGEVLPMIDRLSVSEARHMPGHSNPWPLVGVASSGRYVKESEKQQLDVLLAPLGRAEATRAVLIPIRKSAAWWVLAQDRRREIFEERSRHIAGTLHALPAVARKLYHSRDLGEPFDFLTWFEFAPEHTDVFHNVLRFLRATPEWAYVDREVEVWCER